MGQNSRSENTVSTSSGFTSLLRLAQLQLEKCELFEARKSFSCLLERAKEAGDIRMVMEALAGLFRLAAEALDEAGIQKWDDELNHLMISYPSQIPPMVWYCKGTVARYQRQFLLAQTYVHRYLRSVRSAGKPAKALLRGWVMLAILLQQRNHVRRSEWLAKEILKRYASEEGSGKYLRRYRGIIFLLLGSLREGRRDFKGAERWFQQAQTEFLASHNWYYHLYVLYGYARIERQRHNFSQAYFYLDWVEKAASHRDFSLLRKETARERVRLDQSAVDLEINRTLGVIRTRERGEISLRKQFILANLLDALILAHRKSGDVRKRGLSKAELIERVWNESYRAELHDNKLYYNINRLRKLIEPNVHHPRYLLNWEEGYRLAPGLKIQETQVS